MEVLRSIHRQPPSLLNGRPYNQATVWPGRNHLCFERGQDPPPAARSSICAMTVLCNFPCRDSVLEYRDTGQVLTCVPDDWSWNRGSSLKRSASRAKCKTGCLQQRSCCFGAQHVAGADAASGGFVVIGDFGGNLV